MLTTPLEAHFLQMSVTLLITRYGINLSFSGYSNECFDAGIGLHSCSVYLDADFEYPPAVTKHWFEDTYNFLTTA